MARRLDNSLPDTPATHWPSGIAGWLFSFIGNPLNDGTWTYTWENGRQLARMQSVDTDASFVYNENGLRVQKTVNGVVTNYTLHGKNVVHMTKGNDNLHFFYDAQGRPAVVVYNGIPYSYAKNLQGDIVAILNSAGTAVVNYVYDAWGRPISKTGTLASTLGTVQPFRYRGYVYDEETGLYYLRSRFFCPIMSRFVNADCYLGTTREVSSHNIYAYCRNQPINCIDDNGAFLIIVTVGLEDAIASSDINPSKVHSENNCDCLYQIIAGAVIPVKGGPPNGYLSGTNSKGELYEGWYDSNGDIEWSRHHSHHNNPKEHPDNPHDHPGIKDENGNPTLGKQQKKNPDYEAPDSKTDEASESDGATNISNALIGATLVYLAYRGAKFLIGGLLAPATGGASLIPAFAP